MTTSDMDELIIRAVIVGRDMRQCKRDALQVRFCCESKPIPHVYDYAAQRARSKSVNVCTADEA